MSSLAPPSEKSFPLGGDRLGDTELVRKLQRTPSETYYLAFVQRYEGPVFALLSRYLSGSSMATVEDLAQETFLRAFRALPAFDLEGEAHVSTWLLTIASRLALDAKKRKNVIATHLDSDRALKIASDQNAPEGELRRRELGRALERATSSLPEDQRLAFLLSEYHGLSLKEVATALEAPENTIKTRIFRAREKLRSELEHWRTV